MGRCWLCGDVDRTKASVVSAFICDYPDVSRNLGLFCLLTFLRYVEIGSVFSSCVLSCSLLSIPGYPHAYVASVKSLDHSPEWLRS